MIRILAITTFSVFLFSACNGQSNELKTKNEDETLKALIKWFNDPIVNKDLIDLSTREQLQDSGRTENNLREGYWKVHSIDSSMVSQQVEIIGNNKTVPMKLSSVLVKETGFYRNGKRNGVWTLYKSIGLNPPFHWNRSSETFYKSDKKDGVEKIYQGFGEENQSPLVIRNWTNNIENGIGRVYDSNPPHKLLKLYNAINGNLWILESYYPTGTIQSKFKDSLINKVQCKYYEEYYENGKLKITGFYLNGEQQFGTWTWFYENGTKKRISNYSNGVLNGNFKFYFDNGQLWIDKVYRNGDLWSVIANYDKKGKKKNPGTLKNGTGTVNIYDEQGNLSEKLNYVEGQEQKGSR